MARWMLAAGALVMALGVALGAVSAHAARDAVHPNAAHILEAAVTYHLVHGVALVIEATLARLSMSRWIIAAYSLHAAGILLFCGALWIIAMTGAHAGILAPVGGFAFIFGWIALALHALKK
jgi:uncharacterized membrane protein YgdD (TMEM256/DUF423 family)